MNTLNKKWKEFLYGFSCFGPNFLMILMGAYFTDAINPVALGDGSYQAIMSGVCFITPAVFPILYMIGKIFDGVIDIPFAHITDTLQTKWGRRRPTIAVCFLPMVLSYAMCWWPIGGANNQLFNTIWIGFWCLVFFATYTMCLISYYGSLSTTCNNEAQCSRVSTYKSFFDTISYCLVYALVPLLLDVMHLHIDKFVFIALPLMLTNIIPLFMIKEGEKYGYPENRGEKPQKITFGESLKLTFSNKPFRSFLLVNGCTFFGMQMFLVGMNAMIIGGMGFNGAEMALVNSCAFAPVPVMLYLFNKVKAKKGARFTYQTCLLAFAIALVGFFCASKFVVGENKILQYLLAGGGGVIASWAIGAFFLMPYLAPSQVASVEERLTGKNHSAMYFAGNAVVTTVAGAISSSLVYENIKMLFINKSTGKIVWAESFADAALKFGGVSESLVFNFGTMLVPFIVALACVIGFFLAFKMPKDFTPYHVAKMMKEQNPALDISEIESEKPAKEEKGELTFIQIGLSILSGFIFGFIWVAYLFRSLKELLGKKSLLPWILSCFIPFAGIYFLVKRNKQLQRLAKEKGIQLRACVAAHIVLGLLFPILPVNVVSLALTQRNVNRLYAAEEEAESVEESVVEEPVNA